MWANRGRTWAVKSQGAADWSTGTTAAVTGVQGLDMWGLGNLQPVWLLHLFKRVALEWHACGLMALG
jgi:hypothetical protein